MAYQMAHSDQMGGMAWQTMRALYMLCKDLLEGG